MDGPRLSHTLGLSVASIVHDTSFLFDPTYLVKDYRYLNLRPLNGEMPTAPILLMARTMNLASIICAII